MVPMSIHLMHDASTTTTTTVAAVVVVVRKTDICRPALDRSLLNLIAASGCRGCHQFGHADRPGCRYCHASLQSSLHGSGSSKSQYFG